MFPSLDEIAQQLRGQMVQAEEIRQVYRALFRRMMWWLLSAAVTCVLWIGLLGHMPGWLHAVAAAAAVGITIALAVLLVRRREAYRQAFKELIVRDTAELLLQGCAMPNETDRHRYDCSYAPTHRLADHYIHGSRLFPGTISEIAGEDLFSGHIGLTEFEFSELKLIEERIVTDSKGHSRTERITLFDGLLFVADFHKDFSGVTTLHTAHMFNTGKLGALLKPFRKLAGWLDADGKKEIKLENELFNRQFYTRTTDEIKARYILSSSMMERILAFKKQHREPIEFSFVNSLMCVAIHTRRNYFEPNFHKPLDHTQVAPIYHDLLFFFNMVEAFDLNTRIWSKD